MKNRLAAFFMQKKEVPCMGYACKDVEKTKKIAKKFVRYQDVCHYISVSFYDFPVKNIEEKSREYIGFFEQIW